MPRKGTILSPEAKEKNDKAIAKWHMENITNLSIGVRKGKRDAYKELARRRGTSVSKLVQDYMDEECRKEGITGWER